MGSRARNRFRLAAVSWLFAALWAGCYEVHVGEPGVSMATLGDSLAEGPRRLEIDVLPGTPPIATRVEVERLIELTDDEVIGTSVLAPGVGLLDPGAACSGRLTTQMTEELRFDADTTVFFDGPEEIGCEELVVRVGERIDRGESPFLFAERPAPVEPRDPEDPIFRATEIQIAGDVSPRETVEINADADNLSGCEQLESPPDGCLGTLEVLGRDVLLQEAVTRIELDPRARLDR